MHGLQYSLYSSNIRIYILAGLAEVRPLWVALAGEDNESLTPAFYLWSQARGAHTLSDEKSLIWHAYSAGPLSPLVTPGDSDL